MVSHHLGYDPASSKGAIFSYIIAISQHLSGRIADPWFG
jgi:hypothetical protein